MIKKSFMFSIVVVIATIILAACGGSSDGGASSSSSSSSESLSKYAGKWELFQVGDVPGEMARFTVKITSAGGAEVTHTASKLGYGDEWISEGSGTAELNGDVLYIELTKGMSAGSVLRLRAVNGNLYLQDGQALKKSY